MKNGQLDEMSAKVSEM